MIDMLLAIDPFPILYSSLLSAIVFAVVGGVAFVLRRMAKLEQAVFNGLADRMKSAEDRLDWLVQDTLVQARAAHRPVPSPIPEPIHLHTTTEIPEAE